MRSLVAVAVAVGLLAVAGCSDLQGTDGKDYVGGEGQIVVIEPEDREAPVEASGPDLDGADLTLEDYRGQVLVVNLWWSGCSPCRREMPLLEDVVGDIGDDAALLGINTRDMSPDNALAFMRGVGVEFPSFYDPGGEVLLEFPEIRPSALPSTAVLDREGRLAALVSGEITSPVTLRDVINDVVAEDG
ncbi:TlpA disulfide reductase family protein [Nocardioides sp.]|uniref:TlpA disulfide reductase family protein n=1 Tax=Nocardioides sp. TaxID=35761 RepID=UPI001A24C4C7|nr:TlpA disulfide reductase family protein [Nocardioides sp.]MBJ7359077.1 TlpA family protein disulfide reductase [Nocardioides sp.]